ncbi:MAG: gas vesicle protein [Chloroflexi bacterium]|nr:gas vesicle protein [Chloroflexota bacterium]
MAQLEAATLVDVLDRVLDRGLVVQADVIICLAGVPLVGLNLRAVVAGIETMLDYGLMTATTEPAGLLSTAEVRREALERGKPCAPSA